MLGPDIILYSKHSIYIMVTFLGMTICVEDKKEKLKRLLGLCKYSSFYICVGFNLWMKFPQVWVH